MSPYVATLATLLLAAQARAETGSAAAAHSEPLWEFGLGAGVLLFNDYRGATDMHAYPLPIPYFVYRGTILRSDREGLHGRFLHRSYVSFDLSLNATAPVFTRAAGPRAGMPSLDSTVELGPALQAHLWRSADRQLRFDLRAAARHALTVSTKPRSVGWMLAPSLNLDYGGAATAGWELGLQAGPLYAQRRYDEYFYRVAPQYETATRPAYDPHGGYAGSQLLLSVSKRYAGYWVGAYLRHDWLAAASFVRSPLVQQQGYWAGGVGVVWMIRASSHMVDSDE